MEYSINILHTAINTEGVYFTPKSNSKEPEDSRLMIACSDSAVGEALCSIISAFITNGKALTTNDFNDALDYALKQCENSSGKCDLAFAAFHKNGCLVAQMGNSRIVQIRQNKNESTVEYDSHDQVLDIYSSKAKIEQIRDIKPNDIFILCLKERFNLQKLLKTSFAKDEYGKYNIDDINLAIDDQAQAKFTSIVQIDDVSGINPLLSITDLNIKWYLLSFILILAISVVGILTFHQGAPSESEDVSVVSDSTAIDSTSVIKTDSIVPAVAIPVDTIKETAIDTSLNITPENIEDSIVHPNKSEHKKKSEPESHKESPAQPQDPAAATPPVATPASPDPSSN